MCSSSSIWCSRHILINNSWPSNFWIINYILNLIIARTDVSSLYDFRLSKSSWTVIDIMIISICSNSISIYCFIYKSIFILLFHYISNFSILKSFLIFNWVHPLGFDSSRYISYWRWWSNWRMGCITFSIVCCIMISNRICNRDCCWSYVRIVSICNWRDLYNSSRCRANRNYRCYFHMLSDNLFNNRCNNLIDLSCYNRRWRMINLRWDNYRLIIYLLSVTGLYSRCRYRRRSNFNTWNNRNLINCKSMMALLMFKMRWLFISSFNNCLFIYFLNDFRCLSQ